jgi:TonB family protein
MGSAFVHVLVVASLFLLPVARPTALAMPDAIQVALVDAPLAARRPAPDRSPREPDRTVPDLEPTEEEGVRLKPPDRKATPEPAAQEREPEPGTPDPAPAGASWQPTSRVGLRGQVAVEGGDFVFTYYLTLVRNRIASTWAPPHGLPTGGQPVRAVVYFRIGRDGRLSGIELRERSGVESFDRTTLRAVTLSDPMPPLPEGFAAPQLGVHFGFEYTQP